ncbi:MAG TPA: AAA family ATPase [Candidatus Thermoplasmatota archaeon]|nr:AAA family ATPase [Candidatus Thermoplasmatota archaeon]
MPAEAGTPNLVGRDAELSLLWQKLAATRDHGRGSCVVLLGEAGLGKTTLVREFETRAKSGSVRWFEGACLPEASVPFLPFHDALTSYFALREDDSSENRTKKISERLKDASPELLQLVPVVGNMLSAGAGLYRAQRLAQVRDATPADPREERERRFEAMGRFLSGLAKPETPVVVFVDDLQWADSSSLAFFHYFARIVPKHPILLLATVRAEEAEGPANEALTIMSREGLVERLALKPLGPQEVARLAAIELGASPTPDLASTLSAATDGNPLFCVETLRMLREESALEEDDGRYRLKKGSRVHLPQKVTDVLARRSQRLSRDERLLLDCAAVFGTYFDPVLVAEVLAQPPLQVLQRFEEIARAHRVLLPAGEDHLAFSHGSLREYLQATLSPALRRQYHLQIAKVLDRQGPATDEKVALTAFHAIAGKDTALGIRWSVEAARRARAKYANEEALRCYRDALALMEPDGERATVAEEGGDLAAANGEYREAERLYRDSISTAPEDGARRARVLVKIVEMWSSLGKMREAHKPFEEMDALLPSMDPAQRARALSVKNYYLLTLGEDVKAAVDATAQALELLTDLQAPREEMLRTFARHASTLNYSGRFREALEACARARELEAAGSPDVSVRLRTHLNVGMALAGLGRLTEAITTLREGLTLAEKTGRHQFVDLLGRELGFCLVDAGELAEARTCLAKVELSLRKMNLVDAGENEPIRGRIELAEGRTAEAIAAFERGLAGDRADSEHLFVPRHLCDLAQARLAAGDLDGAEAAAREALQLGRHHLHVVPKGRRTLALAHAARGEREEALRQLDLALATCQELGMEGEAARVQLTRSRVVGGAQGRQLAAAALAVFERGGYVLDAAQARPAAAGLAADAKPAAPQNP